MCACACLPRLQDTESSTEDEDVEEEEEYGMADGLATTRARRAQVRLGGGGGLPGSWGQGRGEAINVPRAVRKRSQRRGEC